VIRLFFRIISLLFIAGVMLSTRMMVQCCTVMQILHFRSFVLYESKDTKDRSDLSKWILLKWITHLNGYHLSGPI